MAINVEKGVWKGQAMNGDLGDLQAQFSLAYIQAVASAAGYFVDGRDRGWDKDGVDVSIMRRGARGVVASPQVDVQVKSHQGGLATGRSDTTSRRRPIASSATIATSSPASSSS